MCCCNPDCYCYYSRNGSTLACQWSRPVSGCFDIPRGFNEEQPDNRTCAGKAADCVCIIIRDFLLSLLIAYLFWLIFFRPYKVRPHIDAAALAAFDLGPVPVLPAGMGMGIGNATATALRYDIALNMSFFNDHRIYGISFDHLTAALYYNGTKLGPSDDTLPDFKLRTRRHRTVYPALRGRASNVSQAVAEQFTAERAEGHFNVDVRVKTTLTYRFWPTRTTYYYEYDCWLQFTPPPAGDATPAVTGGVKCGIDK